MAVLLLSCQDPSQQCDQWCYKDHQGVHNCPAEYDALILARHHCQHQVAALIQEIRDGTRKPGDGLAETQGPGGMDGGQVAVVGLVYRWHILVSYIKLWI